MSAPHTTDRELASFVDGAWLRMDTPTNPMVITSLLTFAEPVREDALLDVVRERLLCHARFCERVVVHAGVRMWEKDPLFDVRSHVHHVALPAGGGAHALEELVSDFMSTPLDPARPLWQLYLVDGVGAGSAVVVRLHHGIGDGVALVQVLLGLTREGVTRAPQAVGLAHNDPPHGFAAQLRDHLDEATTLARLLALPFDPPSPFRGRLGVRKRAAWSAPVDVATLKRVAHAANGTVNDALLAAATGAFRRYLGARAPRTSDEELRALLPVNLRTANGHAGLGNDFGLVFLALPLAVDDATARIRIVKERMDVLKHGKDASVALGVLAAMGVATAALERLGVELFSRKATFMITNVPGPPEGVHLAGVKIDAMTVFAPVSGAIGVGLSFISYDGRVRLGVATDARVVSDPEAIAEAFDREVEGLAALAPAARHA